MLGCAVQFLARDVFIDFRGTLPVRTVGAPQVPGVGHPDGTFFLAVPPKVAWSGIVPAGTTIEAAGRAVLAVVPGGPVPTVSPVTERLPVLASAEAAAVPLAVTARTVTKGLLVTVTERLAVTIAERFPVTSAAEGLPVTVTKRLPLSTAETTPVPFTVTARTITKRLPVTVTKRLPLSTAETTPVPFTVTARTITKRLLVTVTERLPVTVTKRLPLSTAETTPVPFTVTARTITKRLLVTVTIRLPVTVTKRLPLSTAGGTSGRLAAAAGAGAETAGVPA
ncbi:MULTISPECIES: hypothetical protein [Micrococcaceae]|uniref:hypothetical protein n=1 Tax=Micrococcaceae TaxID=1268 RepID=UPI0010E80DC2|nr:MULTISPECIES: hypothetical protein [Micrococcaceae]VII95562.1 hypothetical protein [Arthrobacter sp. DR-2P]